MGNWLLILTICAAAVQSCVAVDRGNFKTCDQNAFCKRQRATLPGNSPWEILLDSLNSTISSLQVQVISSRSQARLQLQLIALADSTLHFELDEVNPIKLRYRAQESLSGSPQLSSLKITEQSSDSISLSFGGTGKAILLVKPFRLDVYDGDQLVISVNARGLLNFEHQRVRKSNEAAGNEEPSFEPTEGETKAEAEEKHPDEKPVEGEEEPGLWEETFKSHVDSKPYGPTSVGVDISFPGSRHVYGIPEHADTFALKQTKNGDPYRLYNTDVFEYELYNPMALYGAVPFMMAKRQQGTVGIFWNNAAETYVDIEESSSGSVVSSLMNLVSGGGNEPHQQTHWFSESGIIDLYIMIGPTPKDVVRQYGTLTGKTPLPQRFALGYHQCRWNYNDQEDVHSVNKGFDLYDIPYDVLWLDIEHTDNKKYFTWDPVKFPDPSEMVHNLTAKGRKLVTIVDPHMKRDSSYFFHEHCEQNDFYVKDKNGKIYEGWCWPGSASYPDFFNPAVRDYWASRFALDKYEGTSLDVYTWNDMNEPSVFNGPEVTMPKDCLHYGGYEHRDVHNMYGMMVVEGTIRGQLMRSDYKLRPFVLSRSFFAGSQRFGAVWTGDNIADWEHLAISVPMLLSLSVSGIPFCGADVGGFFNNPDSELLARWYQAGAFQPFFRGHAHLHTKRREPWLFDEQTNKLIKASIKKRYTYLPYWYTLFYEHEKTAAPPMRPLWMEYPQDGETFSIDNQYLLGDSILVHPVVRSGEQEVSVYFPGVDTLWYEIETFKAYEAPGYQMIPVTIEKIPIFQRGGTIVPKKERARRASSLMTKDPYTFIVTLDKQGKAHGRLYIDDGQSLEYQKGSYIILELNMEGHTLSSKVTNQGAFETPESIEKIVIVGLSRAPSSIVDNTGRILEYRYDATSQTLVLRKPNFSVSNEWSVNLKI
ncbi:neutral alpha-glucosidase AB-like isoform X2 [Daphnia carinata]|uniref:neutral alpha-glucosidase AB-like isoform X2 n=1 Tax=Daphnia carinata TaxID=120202 RepID=UPI0025797036|nr:neutral alpha-glucosidase AB-like isoform X2 [Daphnia carinata]